MIGQLQNFHGHEPLKNSAVNLANNPPSAQAPIGGGERHDTYLTHAIRLAVGIGWRG
jgi:hypothetical protein